MNSKKTFKVLPLTMIVFTLIACSTTSTKRNEIVEWASQIARIEKDLGRTITYYQPLLDQITSRPPTNDELKQLSDYNNRITELYNEISSIYVPKEARSVHNLYVENYSLISDTARYYIMSIKMNDISYYDKSVLAAQEANRVGNEAFYAFEDLLDKYSISCSEINFCE